MLYISHKMNEIFALADQVIVLRDGQFVASARAAETSPDQVVRWMVGREIAALDYVQHRDRGTGGPRSREPVACPARTAVAGRTCETSRFLCTPARFWVSRVCWAPAEPSCWKRSSAPARTRPAGTIRLDGRPVRFTHPDQAIKAGIAMTTEDRKTLGLFDRMTVAENITLRPPARADFRPARRPARREARSRLVGQGAGDQDRGRRRSGDQSFRRQPAEVHSGPLASDRAQGLLLDEPTRGIDVGAKAEIYQLIRRLASKGRAIVMTSSELPELLAVSDRIIVLCEGRLAAEIPRALATEEAIMHAATSFLDRAKKAGAIRE